MGTAFLLHTSGTISRQMPWASGSYSLSAHLPQYFLSHSGCITDVSTGAENLWLVVLCILTSFCNGLHPCKNTDSLMRDEY